MNHRQLFAILLMGMLTGSCGLDLNAPDDGNNGSDPDTSAVYQNVSSSNLPEGLSQTTTKAKAGDVDNDGDMDLVVAIEFEANKILINDGNGTFTDESAFRLPSQNYDSQDIALTDFNSNGDLDIFFVGNQNETNELYINDGNGSFSDLSNRIPVTGNSTSVEALDIDGDGSTDIMIGNIGQNVMLMNSGNAFFNNQTTQRLPQSVDPTRDFTFGDITGDNLRDIVVGNENANRVLINNGAGAFDDQSTRIPFITDIEETQDADLVDVDGDGDRDIYFGNSGFQDDSNPQDRLLINDGDGDFTDQTSDRLPAITTNTYDAEFADLDGDEDLDLIVGNYDGGIRVLVNDGNGFFTDETEAWIPENFSPRVTDLEIADLNNDELPDIYITVRNGDDQLLLYEDDE